MILLPSFFLPFYSPKALQVFFLGWVAQSFLWLVFLLSLSRKAVSLFGVSEISSSEDTIRFNLSSEDTQTQLPTKKHSFIEPFPGACCCFRELEKSIAQYYVLTGSGPAQWLGSICLILSILSDELSFFLGRLRHCASILSPRGMSWLDLYHLWTLMEVPCVSSEKEAA